MTEPCASIEDILGNGGLNICWPNARAQLNLALAAIFTKFGCDQTACIQSVPEGTAFEDFLEEGWGGDPPDAEACPILWVTRGCEVFVGVNSPACNLAAGTGWIPVTSVPKKALIRRATSFLETSNPPAAGDRVTVTPALTWVKRPIGAVEFDTGINVSVVNDEFTLDPGEYVIHVYTDTLTMQDSVISIGTQLYDVTNAVALQETSSATGFPAGVATQRNNFHQELTVRVSIIVDTTYQVRVEGQGFDPGPASPTNNFGGNTQTAILIVRD